MPLFLHFAFIFFPQLLLFFPTIWHFTKFWLVLLSHPNSNMCLMFMCVCKMEYSLTKCWFFIAYILFAFVLLIYLKRFNSLYSHFQATKIMWKDQILQMAWNLFWNNNADLFQTHCCYNILEIFKWIEKLNIFAVFIIITRTTHIQLNFFNIFFSNCLGIC